MKTTNVKFFGTMLLLSFSFPIQNVLSGNPIRPDDPSDRPMSSSTMQVESITPITLDILGDNLAISFNSPMGNVVVTIEDQLGNIVSQTAVDTNVNSELLIPIDSWDAGNYTVKVSSKKTIIINGFQL